MTKLERLQNIGIRRLGGPKRGFRYQSQNGRLTKADLDRIQKLRIPPAWVDVAINPAAKGRVQAVGRDAAGRWQYLYHEDHTRIQELRKFKRITKFALALPKMRATVRRHLNQPGLGRDRVLACVLRIISTCFMRPGSEVYASEHGSYGIATLRRKHIKVKGDLIEFDFPGKSGVRQQRQLRDRQVARVIRSTLKLPGFNVFKFINADGVVVPVTRRHVNDYIKEVMGESFSAKDFRTWAGTLVCACALARVGEELNGEPAPTAQPDGGREGDKEEDRRGDQGDVGSAWQHARGVSRLVRLSRDHPGVRERKSYQRLRHETRRSRGISRAWAAQSRTRVAEVSQTQRMALVLPNLNRQKICVQISSSGGI
jgi:DNA topoisomerase-1